MEHVGKKEREELINALRPLTRDLVDRMPSVLDAYMRLYAHSYTFFLKDVNASQAELYAKPVINRTYLGLAIGGRNKVGDSIAKELRSKAAQIAEKNAKNFKDSLLGRHQ